VNLYERQVVDRTEETAYRSPKAGREASQHKGIAFDLQNEDILLGRMPRFYVWIPKPVLVG
jgi:hypothetical protein